jgi:hypothetical protein
MRRLSLVLVVAALFGGMAPLSASAMPIAPLQGAVSSDVENVRWVCGPYRCWWRPNYYYRPYAVYRPYRFYGYRAYGRPWGWRGRYWRAW